MKTIIQIILGLVCMVLAYFIYDSIQQPIRFNREKDFRYSVAIQRLKDIRTAQLAFKSEYGKFTKDWDSLINFIKKGSFRVVKQIGDAEDSVQVAQGKVIRDTIRIPVLDSLFHKGYPIDSIQYVPFTKGTKFRLGIGEIATSSKVVVKVFEASVLNDTLLKGLDRNLLDNFNEERYKITDFAGLKVGSLTEANNNAGNWE